MNSFADAVFLVIDVETTGLDHKRDAVCEIAFVALQGGEIIFTADSLVNPGRGIPAEVSRIHGITDADVAGAPLLADLDIALPPHDCFVAHNSRFDSAFLPHLDERPWLCTQRLARHALPTCASYSNQNLRKSLNLDVGAAEGQPAHRALADALVTAALLKHLLGCMPPEAPDDLEMLVRWVSRPVLQTTCRFGKHKGMAWSQVPKSYLEWMISPNGLMNMDGDTRHTVQHYLNTPFNQTR